MWDVALPLRRPLVAADAVHSLRRSVIVSVSGDGSEGWGEAAPLPGHTRDDIHEAWEVIQIEALRLLATEEPVLIDGATSTAALDAALSSWRAAVAEVPLAVHIGGEVTPVDASAAIGLTDTEDELLTVVAAAVAAGHRHIKLKIAPDRVGGPASVRRHFPDLGIAVDANGSFERRRMTEIAVLDELGLTYIEQPLPALDLEGSATLRMRMTTPICLDESVGRLGDIVTIAGLGAADAISVKPGRMGPALAGRAIALAERHRLDVKIGGLVATGIGKALDIAVATLPHVSLPSDLAASSHWFADDLVAPPWTLSQGALQPHTTAGVGVTVDRDRLTRIATRYARFPR